MPSVCIVQLQATVNNIKLLNVAQKNYGEFVTLVTFGPNLTKFVSPVAFGPNLTKFVSPVTFGPNLTKFVSPVTFGPNLTKFVSPVAFGPNLTKSEVTQRIFLGVPNFKFHRNPSNESRGQTDRQTDRHAEANKYFLRLCERA